MGNDLDFKLINSFKCKRCGCTNYDKLIYTGMKTLNDDDSIIHERYVCRNCDLPFKLENYIDKDTVLENINSSGLELVNNSEFIDEGVENINEDFKKENEI